MARMLGTTALLGLMTLMAGFGCATWQSWKDNWKRDRAERLAKAAQQAPAASDGTSPILHDVAEIFSNASANDWNFNSRVVHPE